MLSFGLVANAPRWFHVLNWKEGQTDRQIDRVVSVSELESIKRVAGW